MKKFVFSYFQNVTMGVILLSLFALIGCRHHTQTTPQFQQLPYPVKINYDTIVFEKDYSTRGEVQAVSTCHQEKLMTMNADFAARIKEVGAGRLQDGRTIGLSHQCECGLGYNCFTFLNSEQEWGLTSRRTARHLYTSVTASSLALGTILYIPALDGTILPNTKNQKHNGYVRVDSRDYSEHNQINLFVGTKKTAKKFAYLFNEAVTVDICMTAECGERVQRYETMHTRVSSREETDLSNLAIPTN